MNRFLKIVLLCFKNIRYIFLRVTVYDRKPGALNLHHNPVSLLKYMIQTVEVDSVFFNLNGYDGRRFFETHPETTAEHIIGDHELISCHLRFLWILFRIYVDEFYDPVSVAACRGGKQFCRQSTGNRH